MNIKFYNRTYQCKHCGHNYTPKRSDQKFCSTSHRVANHQFKKRARRKEIRPPEADLHTKKPISSIKNIGHSAIGSIGGSILTQSVEKAAGFHNSDILKAIDEMKKMQLATNYSNAVTKALLEKTHALLTSLTEKNNLWMFNIN